MSNITKFQFTNLPDKRQLEQLLSTSLILQMTASYFAQKCSIAKNEQ